MPEEWDWEANKLTFGDLSDVFVEVEPLGYVLVFFLLLGTTIVWALLGVLVWGAFPLRTVWPLMLSLLTFSLQGGLWTEMKSLERNLHSLVAEGGAESKKRTARLNRLDVRYGLLLETIRLLVHRRQQLPLSARVERLVATLKRQRYCFQGELVRLRGRYYPRLDRILGDRDRADRQAHFTQDAIQGAIADLQAISHATSDRHLSSAIQPIVDRLNQSQGNRGEVTALLSATETSAPVDSQTRDDGAIATPNSETTASQNLDSVQLTVRNPIGQYIADISVKSKKYHCSEDCQIWKGLMYDFMMNRNANLLCDRSAEIFEKSGLQLCNSCQKKRKNRPQ